MTWRSLGDSIVAVGDVGNVEGRTEIDVTGLAVAPGFINMLSWATESLLQDGRGLSDVLQGVTLEVFGEGMSMGPLNDSMRALMVEATRATSSSTSPGPRSASTSSTSRAAASR